MTTLAGLLFQRFADIRDEQRFRLESRTGQGKFVRGLMLIGAGMLSLYVALAPLYLPLEDTLWLLASTAIMAPALVLYAWYVGRPGYARHWWVDLAFFAVL